MRRDTFGWSEQLADAALYPSRRTLLAPTPLPIMVRISVLVSGSCCRDLRGERPG
jgi:hypothetical protein